MLQTANKRKCYRLPIKENVTGCQQKEMLQTANKRKCYRLPTEGNVTGCQQEEMLQTANKRKCYRLQMEIIHGVYKKNMLTRMKLMICMSFGDTAGDKVRLETHKVFL